MVAWIVCIGLGLGLPGLKPGCNKADLRAVLAQNDNILTEQQMLNDKVSKLNSR